MTSSFSNSRGGASSPLLPPVGAHVYNDNVSLKEVLDKNKLFGINTLLTWLEIEKQVWQTDRTCHFHGGDYCSQQELYKPSEAIFKL